MVDDGRPGHHDVLTGGLPVPETPGTDQPPRADSDPGTGEGAL